MKSKKLLSLGLAMSMFVACYPISANALDKIDKIQGADKYETAGLIADKQSYATAILINADSTMADGLSASGLAGATNAPILLTKKNNIPNATLKRVEKANKVYIIGGESSIDKATETFLKDKGIETKRLQGNDRIKTSYNVAKEINSINKVNKVILTNAFKGEPDAMSIASVAVRDKAPIILTDGKSVPFNTTGIESYAIGGTSSMSDKLVNDTNSTRLGGADRYDTNKKIVNKLYNGIKEFYIASGTDLVYALVGSTIAKNTPIVLVDDNSNKTVLKGATKITAIGNLNNNAIEQSLNITKNIASPTTGGKYTVKEATERIAYILDEKVFVDYESAIKAKTDPDECFRYYIKNFTYQGKDYYAIGADDDDFRFLVNMNNLNDILQWYSNNTIKRFDAEGYLKERKAIDMAFEACSSKYDISENDLILDREEHNISTDFYVVVLYESSGIDSYWVFIDTDTWTVHDIQRLNQNEELVSYHDVNPNTEADKHYNRDVDDVNIIFVPSENNPFDNDVDGIS
ncbi:cell wall-binding repeat-containing protein [Clostridioides difficile]|uniref:Cell wall-binding repeat-containing protein n=6 Tax=Clostridioides difficile TaxID=1496 RepID=A0A9P4DBD0_CLODI|nr:cell wall-binding repeat-containing protein [Clostridioides difficile]AWH77995.1 cell wall-binding repeat-containing protein [Clostridioides difficile]AWH81737.1 cell wall-binding repeat-containing protein [Clostridioides difficile]AXU46893.1 cell surface protein [Clostridioides difficile]AXU65022.1 cell surface protein [Clostridioides difficile]EGT2216716.1 cell surface protein [Clostridioides difficile]